MIWYAVIGLASGLLGGMGFGGGTILIPAMVILMGTPQQMAQNINLLVFMPVACIALIVHVKNGNIEKKIILRIILFGVISTAAGSFLALNLGADLLRRIFGFFLLAVGVSEFFKKGGAKVNQYDFEDMKLRFISADTNGKIDLYVSAKGLSQQQYKELLRYFPYQEISKLEQALQAL